MSAEARLAFEFGGFRLEPRHRCLSGLDGQPIVITDKAFDALVYLVERAGLLTTKDQLVKVLWPSTVVEDSNLYVTISALRRALGDDPAAPRLIATIAGRGYQFIGEVRRIEAPPRAAAQQHEPPPTVAAQSNAPATANRRRFLIAGAVMVSAVAIGAVVFTSRRAARAPGAVTTLAVLPFKPLTPDDRNESLEFGMTDTLIAGLNASNLSVSPLSSVRRFASIDQDARAAGRALGVDAVLEGHMQRVGNQLRVSARLLDVSDGRQLWAQRYDEAFTDIFSVQDTIAAKVRAALTVELAGEGSPALRRYTEDAEAYQLYANGRFHQFRLQQGSLLQSLEYYQQAVERDPSFALAYVGISETRSMMAVFGVVAPHDTYPQARQAVERALQLAPDLGEAYASLGHIKMQYEHDWVGAERALRRSIDLNPNYARAHQFMGLFLGYRGRFDEGIAQLRRAQALEPAQPVYSALIGMLMLYDRRYDDAIEQLRLTLQMDAEYPTTITYLAAAYLRRGDYDESMAHLARLRSPAPGSAAYFGQICALTGRRKEAVQELERLKTMSQQSYVSAYDIATIHGALGDIDAAFDWLGRAFEERSQLIPWLPWDPAFDGLRKDSRYVALARRLE